MAGRLILLQMVLKQRHMVDTLKPRHMLDTPLPMRACPQMAGRRMALKQRHMLDTLKPRHMLDTLQQPRSMADTLQQPRMVDTPKTMLLTLGYRNNSTVNSLPPTPNEILCRRCYC